jgi:hypothetical protein
MSVQRCARCGANVLEPEHACAVELVRDPPAAEGSPEALWLEVVFSQVLAKLKRELPRHAAGHAFPSRAVDRARRRGAR